MGLRSVDEGYDFRVLVLDDTWVVRIARRPACAEALAAEAEFLPILAAALPVQVPEFAWTGSGVAVYPLIEGTPLVDEEHGVREFLDALHAVPLDGLPAPRPDWQATYRRQGEKFREIAPPELRQRSEALFAEVETLTGFEPAFTHSDLGPEHLLCRNGKLVGVIDWGDARVGDPALDYAWLLHGPFAHWDVDDELRRRALVYHQLAPSYEAHFRLFIGAEPQLAPI